jgi:thiamine-monophosphate kinase
MVAPGLTLGIGDDAAVIRPAPGEDLVWTVDALEEEVDFRREWLSAREVGARAVLAAASDLAAMGARPLAVLLCLGSGAPEPGSELLQVFEGAAAAARDLEAIVAGGDLTRRAGGLGAAVTAIGAVPAGGAWTRAGARPGDELWVTGVVGRAARGLELLGRLGRRAAEADDPDAVRRWTAPVPRLAEARWLRRSVPVRAAIDLSDGLALDLARLAGASGAGARLDEAALREAVGGVEGTALEHALAGGEDFELLLAVAAGSLDRLSPDFTRELGTPIRRIGRVVTGEGVVVEGRTGRRPLSRAGWDHVRPRASGAASSNPRPPRRRPATGRRPARGPRRTGP